MNIEIQQWIQFFEIQFFEIQFFGLLDPYWAPSSAPLGDTLQSRMPLCNIYYLKKIRGEQVGQPEIPETKQVFDVVHSNKIPNNWIVKRKYADRI